MTEHIQGLIRNLSGWCRTVCSCGQYRSKWYFYPGRAEIAWRAHVRHKTAYEAKKGNA